MSGISRDSDSAGGNIIATSASTQTFCENELITVHGDSVTPHGSGIHASATMISSQDTIFINGIAVCKQGDFATCGHTSSGSSTVFIN